MSTPLSPADLEATQRDLLKGAVDYDQLPASTLTQLQDYWDTHPNAQQDQNTDPAALAKLKQDRASVASQGDILSSPIFKPVEWLGSKLYSLYSNTVSPATSMVALTARRLIWGKSEDDPTGFTDTYKDLWNEGHAISPGQAIWMMGFSDKELKARGIAPNQLTQNLNPKDYAWSGLFGPNPTKTTTAGEKAKDEYFNNGAAQFVTGALDFGVSWYADPLVLGGKVAGAAKVAGITKPVSKLATKSGGDFDKLAASSSFSNMTKQVMDIKAKNPDTAALVLRDQFKTVKESANGDQLARLLAEAKDESQVTRVLRVSIGDYKGYLGLEADNMRLAYQVKTATQRVQALNTSYNALPAARQSSLFGQKLKAYIGAQEDMVSKLDSENGILTETMKAFGSVDNLNYNRITTPIGMKIRAGVQDAAVKQVKGQGIIKAVPALIYNAAVGFPIHLIRSYNDIKPSAYLELHAEDSYKELGAALDESRSLTKAEKDKYVSDYIKSTPNERGQLMVNIERGVGQKILDKVNADRARKGKSALDQDMAHQLYDDFVQRRSAAQGSARTKRSYSASRLTNDNTGLSYNVAEIDAGGGRTIATPLYETQLANSHVVMDFNNFEKILQEQGDSFQTLKNSLGNKWHTGVEIADTLGTYWKFAQLFRLGYAPRALADDFMGQVARYGALSMASRAGKGAVNVTNKILQGTWAGASKGAITEQLKIQHAMNSVHLEDLGRVEQQLKIEIAGKQGTHNVSSLQQDLADVQTELQATKDDMLKVSNTIKGASEVDKSTKVGRQVFNSPLGGVQGNLFRDLLSGERNFGNMMGRAADWHLKRARAGDWENIQATVHGVDRHRSAWARKINDQIAQSAVGRQMLAGKSEDELVNWMRTTPEGRAYRADIGDKNMPIRERAKRVLADFNDTLNPNIVGMDSIKADILAGKFDMKKLEEIVPVGARPIVNGESFKYASGTSALNRTMDNMVTGFYNVANQIPANKLLRNPLFAQQYKAHLSEQMKTLKSQGITHVDENLRRTMEETARRKSLRDVKNFTFTMDHETKMAYHLRHFGAFFGAQQESWNRWAKIIAEKPQTLPHVAQVYNAPARVGMVTDVDGNPVDGAGYSTDPITGEKKLTDFSQRKILFQVPDYLGGKALNKALGLDENAKFSIPVSSVELVLNHGDGPLPVGTGPMVQIGVNHFAQDDPKVADWAQQMGVLPFGPTNNILDFINPTTGKRLGDSSDDLGQVKQRSLLYMMQVETYKYENGLRDTQPTWTELKDRADKWTMFRAVAAFGLPVSLNAQDPYQYFRDEYSRMQNVDPTRADEAFYEKYGDSLYSFTTSMSKNATGLRPTQEGVQASKYYQDLINKVGPEYASVVVGDEGNGTYSQGAYFYQKTHATDIAASSTDRTSLGARDAFATNRTNLGWKQYQSAMTQINSQLFDRGLSSFDAKGAEDLKGLRASVISALSQSKLPTGEDNPYYNRQWAEDFNTLNDDKYNERAVDMQKIVDDPEIWSKAYDATSDTVGQRSDIYSLKSYLFYRNQMQVALQQRKLAGGSGDINAAVNNDLRSNFSDYTTMLMEQDTKFETLHSRWFATDMGYNSNEVALQTTQTPESTIMTGLSAVQSQVAANSSALQGDLYGG